jgi:hypothetical protein
MGAGRIATLIGRRFHKSYTEQGVRLLLIRHGWSWQVRAAARSNATTPRSRRG